MKKIYLMLIVIISILSSCKEEYCGFVKNRLIIRDDKGDSYYVVLEKDGASDVTIEISEIEFLTKYDYLELVCIEAKPSEVF